MSDPAPVLLEIEESDADAERLDRLTAQLFAELRELEAVEVERPLAGPASPGARSIEMAAIGALLVSVPPAIEAIRGLIEAVRAWQQRGPARSVKLTIGGDSLELGTASPQEQARIVEVMLSRFVAKQDDGTA